MREASAVAEWLRECAVRDANPDDLVFVGAELDGLPDTDAGFTIELADGTRFAALVVMIEEGGR